MHLAHRAGFARHARDQRNVVGAGRGNQVPREV